MSDGCRLPQGPLHRPDRRILHNVERLRKRLHLFCGNVQSDLGEPRLHHQLQLHGVQLWVCLRQWALPERRWEFHLPSRHRMWVRFLLLKGQQNRPYGVLLGDVFLDGISELRSGVQQFLLNHSVYGLRIICKGVLLAHSQQLYFRL